MRSESRRAADQLSRGLRDVLRFGLAGQAMGTLVGGVFLVKVALLFGAPLFVIGLLAALPSLAQLVQVPATYLVEQYRERKRIALYSFAGVRLSILALALVPVLFAREAALAVLLLAVLFRGMFAAAAGSAWNSWLRDLVPQEQFGSFFATRQRRGEIVSVVLSLAAAWFIGEWVTRVPDRELTGYALLFGAGFVAGVVSLLFLRRIPEPTMPPVEPTRFVELLARPFRDPNFRRLIGFLGSWNFAMALVAPFFTVYLLGRLGYSMPFVIGLTVLSQVTNAAFARLWGRLSDAFSNKAVLGVSGPLFLLSTLLWLFTAMPEKHAFTVPLLVVIHVLLGMAMSGVTLASGNIGMKLAPAGRATSYLAATSLVGSLAAGVGPIVGGVVANAFEPYRFAVTVEWEGPGGLFSIPAFYLRGIDFAFILAILVGLYSIHRLTAVVEEGELERAAVVESLIAELKRPLLTFTTVGGFAELVYFPASVARRRRNALRGPAADDVDDSE